MIRKFEKKDTKEVADLIWVTFKKYNGDDYFNINGVIGTLDYFDAKKYTLDELFNKFCLSPIFLVYEIDSKIAGIARGNKNKLSSLYVTEEYHKKGIGSKLIKAFEKEAVEQGSERICINASLFAAEFYEKAGYRKMTDIVDFSGLKVYKMERDLIDK